MSKIYYTLTDEAPLLATHSFLPRCGVDFRDLVESALSCPQNAAV